MNYNYLVSKLNQKNKGQWFKMTYISDVPVKAAFKKNHTVNKLTTSTVRYGISYDNIKSVQQKTADGTLNRIHDLPWGKWVANMEGIFIQHTNKEGRENIYLRVYNSPNKPVSVYFLNGKQIDKEELKNMGIVQDSVWNKKEASECFTVNVANITEIG